MSQTRAGEVASVQISKMGNIATANGDFTLPDGQCFLIKNDSGVPVMLTVQLSSMEDGEYVDTLFNYGWNPEIVKRVKQTSETVALKWGY